MYKVNYYSSFLRTITQPTRYKPKFKTFFSTCSLHIYLLLFFPFPFSHPPQFFFIIFFFRFLSLDSSFLLSSVFPTLTNCLSLSPPHSLLSSTTPPTAIPALFLILFFCFLPYFIFFFLQSSSLLQICLSLTPSEFTFCFNTTQPRISAAHFAPESRISPHHHSAALSLSTQPIPESKLFTMLLLQAHSSHHHTSSLN